MIDCEITEGCERRPGEGLKETREGIGAEPMRSAAEEQRSSLNATWNEGRDGEQRARLTRSASEGRCGRRAAPMLELVCWKCVCLR